MKQIITTVNTKGNKGIFIGIGSNIGDRTKNIETALEEISNLAKITNKSTIIETKPVGYDDQGDFLNLVVEIETDLSPLDLLKHLNEIENKMGRIRTIKDGPRIIDLDILLYKNQTISQKNLKIPHPRMHEREFVLKPLIEIAPGLFNNNK